MRSPLLLALLATASVASPAATVEELPRYAVSRGPGSPALSSWSRLQPLPKPASQKKRRKLARRSPR